MPSQIRFFTQKRLSKAVSDISLLQCILLCKRHTNCHDVAMDTDNMCFLLRDGVSENSTVEATINATRFTNVDVGATSANITKGKLYLSVMNFHSCSLRVHLLSTNK